MNGTPFLPFGIRALFLGGILLLLAACASTASSSGASSSSSAQDSPGSAGSAAAAGTGRPGTPATSPTAPTPGTSGCSPAPAAITARAGVQPSPVCMHVGDSLTITTQTSPAQPWQPMTTSDAAVLACTSKAADQGALIATCRALAPGTATVSTMQSAFAGDPHGPPQRMWTLTIQVQAAS